MRMNRLGVVALASVMAGGVVWAQVGRGTTEWLTANGDAQRTSWIRTDPNISVDAMSKPGFVFQWKTQARQPAASDERAVAGRVGQRRDALRADVGHHRQLEQRLRHR